MKKRIIVSLVLAVMLFFSLSACMETVGYDDTMVEKETAFRDVEGKDYLVYDSNTRVIYYLFSTAKSSGNLGHGFGYMAPYISENGRYCRYVNDEIVEIIPEDIQN